MGNPWSLCQVDGYVSDSDVRAAVGKLHAAVKERLPQAVDAASVHRLVDSEDNVVYGIDGAAISVPIDCLETVVQ